MGDVLQHGEDGWAVGILEFLVGIRGEGLLGGRVNDAGRAVEGIKLLHEEQTTLVHHVEELLAQLGDELLIAVALQRQDGPLIGQALALAGPVVLHRIAEGRIIRRHAGQGQGRPELVGIQQMLLDEPVRHVGGDAAPVHAAQGVVAQHVNDVAVLVLVKEGAARIVPQIGADDVGDLVCQGAPLLGFRHVAADQGDLAQGIPAGIGEGGHVHGGHGHHVGIRRGDFLGGVVGRIAVADSVVLAGVILAPGFEDAVAVGIAHRPQVGVELPQADCKLVEIGFVLANPVVHVQRGPGEAEALELVELGLNSAVAEALDGTRQTAVRPLVFHKEQMVVQRGGDVVLGVHFAAHGLGLQPDLLVAAALYQHLIAGKGVEVVECFAYSGVVQPLQLGIFSCERYFRLGKHRQALR